MTNSEKGKTAAAGYQVGVRKTWPVGLADAWQWLISPEGMGVWLNADATEPATVGFVLQTRDGVSCEFRVANEETNVRLRWHKPEWERATTVQVRTIPVSSDRTTISFHQEQLPDAEAREAMKRHWEAVSADVGRAIERHTAASK